MDKGNPPGRHVWKPGLGEAPDSPIGLTCKLDDLVSILYVGLCVYVWIGVGPLRKKDVV